MEKQKKSSELNIPLNTEVFKKAPSKRNKLFFVVSSVASLVLIILIASYFHFTWLEKEAAEMAKQGNQNAEVPQGNKDKNPAFVLSSQFANWEDTAVDIKPQVAAYTVDANLGNLTNANDFQISDDAKKLLVKNAFAVVPSDKEEFYPIYESNRYAQIPNFITTDSMLHTYHLMFDDMLKKLEENKLAPELKKLSTAMLADSLAQYESLKGTEWENAAKRNVGFFAVGAKLLDSNVAIPNIVKNEVEKEMTFIEAHGSVENSPVMNIGAEATEMIDTPQGELGLDYFKEDYTQYVPRGHYNKTENLKAYFKAMMWYGRLSFRLKSEDEVKSSLLVSTALASKGSNQESWDKVYEPINFFVGKSDDITYYQYRDLMKEVYGEDVSLANVIKDESKLASFIEKAKKLEAPQINSMPIFNASIQSDRETEIKSFRFLGQRFTIDASIFQRLIYREVGDNKTSCKNFDPAKTNCLDGARCLPRALDVPAAMGSSEAYSILDSKGETKYACYDENMSKMKTYISSLDKSVWTQNLYWGWLYALKPLTEAKSEGYPSFMTSAAWQRKDLNTYLGSWTELKRDTILYTKQVYAELGGGGDEEPKDYRGYVEPEPYVYARLASLIKMTRTGLDSRGLLGESEKNSFNNLEEIALNLKTISEKELNGTGLTDEENDFIKAYGGNLEHIWFDVYYPEGGTRELNDDTNAPVVADVATDPNGLVLEEATGYISEIYVVVPIDGKLRIAKGAVYSYYEFTQPMEDRLTDEKWKEMLKSGSVPALPDWTQVFTSK